MKSTLGEQILPELVRNDVDRALAALGSGSIGYRRFRSRIVPPQEAARPEISLQTAATTESVLPLLMDVVPDEPGASVGIVQSVTNLQVTDLEQVRAPERVNVSASAAGVSSWPAIQDSPVALDVENKSVIVAQLQSRVSMRCKGVSLSDMFKTLGEVGPPAEVTMSQLQEIFRRL